VVGEQSVRERQQQGLKCARQAGFPLGGQRSEVSPCLAQICSYRAGRGGDAKLPLQRCPPWEAVTGADGLDRWPLGP